MVVISSTAFCFTLSILAKRCLRRMNETDSPGIVPLPARLLAVSIPCLRFCRKPVSRASNLSR